MKDNRGLTIGYEQSCLAARIWNIAQNTQARHSLCSLRRKVFDHHKHTEQHEQSHGLYNILVDIANTSLDILYKAKLHNDNASNSQTARHSL
jgi:hypothetical protein